MKTEMVERDCPFVCQLCGFYWEPENEGDSTTVYVTPNGEVYCSENCATKDENILKADCHE